MRQWNDKYSLVRILHAIPEGESIDIFLNGVPFFNDLSFTNFSPYVYVPEGDYRITVYVTNMKENPIIDQDISVSVNDILTIALILDEDKAELLFIEEDTEIASGQNAKVRAIHLAPVSPTVNILADGEVLFSNVSYKDITEYKEVEPKVYRVDLEVAENNKLIRSNQITINENRIYSFYALGNVPNVQIIQSLDGVTFMI